MDNRPEIPKLSSQSYLSIFLLLIVCGCLFYLPVAYYHGVRDASSLPKTVLIALVACSGLLIIFFHQLFHKNTSLCWSPLFIWLLLYVAWCGLAYSWSGDPSHAQFELTLLLNIALFAWLCFILVLRGQEKLLVYAAVSGAVLPAIIGTLQYFDINPVGYMQFGTPASTFVNKNIAASYFDLVLPLSLVFVLIADSRRARFYSGTLFILLFSYQILAHSRGSWLGLGVAGLAGMLLSIKLAFVRVSVVQYFRKVRSVLLLCLVVPLIIVMVSNSFVSHRQFQEKAHSFMTGRADSSVTIRLNSYINALSMVKEKWLTGYGTGSFRVSFRSHMFDVVPLEDASELKELTRLHNEPLQILLEQGLVGFILFFMVLITATKYTFALLRAEIPDKTRLLVLGIFLGLLSSLVHSMLSYTFRMPASALLFAVWLAILAALHHRHIQQRQTSLPRYAILLVISTILLFSYYNQSFYTRYWQASNQRLNIENALFFNQCQHTLQYADEMLEKFDLLFHHRRAYLQAKLACGNDGEKLSALNRILDYEPGNTFALYERGRYYLLHQQPRQAMTDFARVIEILPHRSASYYGLASSFNALGSLDKANEMLNIAVELDKKTRKPIEVNKLEQNMTLQ